MFSFNQPNCITHCLLCEAPRQNQEKEGESGTRAKLEAPRGAFPIFWHLILHSCVMNAQEPVKIQGRTEDRQGAQAYVILVIKASSTFSHTATLRCSGPQSAPLLLTFPCYSNFLLRLCTDLCHDSSWHESSFSKNIVDACCFAKFFPPTWWKRIVYLHPAL